MPVDWTKYPDDWEALANKLKDEADWQCEQCGAGHMEDGTMGTCLTVHHVKQDPENPDPDLQVLCARCHLKEHRRLKREEREKNQLKLFPGH